ncbi:hypothetical protein ACOMHN_045978 [Nucella lapillus]
MLPVTFKQKEQNKGLGNLWDIFHEQLSVYTRHLFNKTTQYNHFRHLRDNLQPNECIVHIDFSENYVGKMHKEIQAFHFGASQPVLKDGSSHHYTVDPAIWEMVARIQF